MAMDIYSSPVATDHGPPCAAVHRVKLRFPEIDHPLGGRGAHRRWGGIGFRERRPGGSSTS